MTEENGEDIQFRELGELARQLPREIEPPADAWQAIEKAISEPIAVPRRIAFWQRPLFLAAAALLLVASSSLVTARVVRERDIANSAAGEIRSSPVEPAADAGSSTSAPAALVEFAALENDYIGTVNRLSAALEAEDVLLAPETIEKLKESLRVIDAAILEARRALAEDPGNVQLIEMLATTYDRKVDLLRRTTEMGRS